jgi:YebC/PmpR family DNA-binding regulatory protein
MPADSIQRAIDRGMGKGNEAQLEEINYEGYAPGGVALIIEAATDNRNRTASEVRAAFTKIGGNPGEPGSVAWMFDLKGLIVVDLAASKVASDEAMMMAIDAGADDVVDSGDTLEVYTDFKQLIAIRQALVAANLTVTNVEKVMRPKTLVQATGPDALKALKLIDRLEELDDVQKVYSNLDITDELAEQFADA